MDWLSDRSSRFDIIGTLPPQPTVKETAKTYNVSDDDVQNVVALVDAEFGQRIASRSGLKSSRQSARRAARKTLKAKSALKRSSKRPGRATAKKSATRKRTVALRKKK